MDFSQETISELQNVLGESYGKEYSVEEATTILTKLVDVYDEIIKTNYQGGVSLS